MKVLILSRKREIYSTRRLEEETAALGHRAIVQDPDEPEIKKTVCDVVIPRFGTWRFEESLQTLNYFERRGIPVMNRVIPLREARNKWISYLVLREEGLPVPQSSAIFKKDFPRLYPYVAKGLEGSKGSDVHLISNAADHMAFPEGEWLVQEFIREAKGRDHRLIVLDGEVIAAMERKAPEGDFRSNLALGGTAHAYEPSKMEIEIAIAATKTLSLRFSGVDLIPSNSGPRILEVNGCPGLEGVEKASGVNVARKIIQSITGSR